MSVMYGNNVFLPPSPVIPNALVITSITNAYPMVVTVSTPNYWIAGQVAYFSIPFPYGIQQLANKSGEVLIVDETNLVLSFEIDSRQFDAFVTPSSGEMPATICSLGARNTYNFLTLPYHSLNAMVGN